jgi:hypothetical protein
MAIGLPHVLTCCPTLQPLQLQKALACVNAQVIPLAVVLALLRSATLVRWMIVSIPRRMTIGLGPSTPVLLLVRRVASV